VLIPQASALVAEYSILPTGTGYIATVEIANAKSYSFVETGVLGERVPIKVTNVTLIGNCSAECNFSSKENGASIAFPLGNYTVSYQGAVREKHIQATFDTPYNVTVFLPPSFSVSNPFLAGLSHGSLVMVQEDNTTLIRWNETTSFDVRFYDQDRETLLYLFGNLWLVIAIVLLLPFLLTMRREGQ
jgi:hypothetical protein